MAADETSVVCSRDSLLRIDLTIGIGMTQKADPIVVEEPVACCDGGTPALGHPKIYLFIDEKGYVDCPYCGQRFVLKDTAGKVAAAS